MPEISNSKIERLAVGAVTNLANSPNSLLIPNIPVGDKGISFDGDIDVLKDHSESVESLLGKVPVQVKGKLVKSFSNDTIKYSLELKHFQNYYNSNGVVLFVVEVLNHGETKVYYKQLLPTELRKILKEYGEIKNQKQRVIELRPLTETTIDIVCRRFLSETKKQSTILIENNPFSEKDYSSFELTSLTYNPGSTSIFEHDFTLYGITGSLHVPLESIRIEAVKQGIEDIVSIDGKEYELYIEFTKTNAEYVLYIEKSLEIKFKEGSSKYSFVLLRLDSLATQLKLIPFFLAFLRGTNIDFKNIGLSLHIASNTSEWIEALEQLQENLEKLRTLYKNLGVPEQLPFNDKPGNVTQLVDKIEFLIRLVNEPDFCKMKLEEGENLARFITYSLDDVMFIFYYSLGKLANAFSDRFIESDTRVEIEGESYPHSPYIMFTVDALANGSNINLEIIKQSFSQIDPFAHEVVFNNTNQFCLMCISAYDITKNIELLKLARDIYDKAIESKLPEMTKTIISINKHQINKRLNGSLNGEEIADLIRIKNKFHDNIEILFCTSVLLGSKVEGDFYFNKFDLDQKEFYEGLPILHLYKST